MGGSDPEAMEAFADRLQEIRNLAEFYLGNKNLKRDAYFWNMIKQDPEGWVYMTGILSGRRMKYIGATDGEVFEALKYSELEVKGTCEVPLAVRRPPHWDLPELPKYTADDTGAEKRLDPWDLKPYSLEEVFKNYAHMGFSEKDIKKFWDEKMWKLERAQTTDTSTAVPS